MANGTSPGLFRNVRWCCKCRQPKELRGGKIKHKNTGKERFICAECCRG